MDPTDQEILRIVRAVVGPAAADLVQDRASALLGSVAEIDSMAVVAILTQIEDSFGIAVGDDEVDGATFASIGSLSDFVRAKLAP